MNRDSTTVSIWQSIDASLDTEKQKEPGIFDVIIIGAGITGLTTALLLQEAGKNCLVLEAATIGFGTSSGTSAHLNTLLDTPYPDIISKFGEENARLIAQAAREAISIIKSNSEKHHISCDFQPRDGFLFAANEQEEKDLEDIFQALQKVGVEAFPAKKIPVPLPFTKAIRFPGQAQFHPTKYLAGLAKAFLQKGGMIREHTRVISVEKEDDLHIVNAGDSQFKGLAAVYATHIPLGVNYLHLKCAPYRSYVMGVRLSDENYPDALAYDMQDPYHYFRTADDEGQKILLVGGCDHKTGHNDNTEHIFTELEAYIRSFYPVSETVYKWSAQYYEPADGLPYIGRLPGGDDDTYVATGYSGNGLIFGTLAGKIIADLVMANDNPYALLLSPARMKPVASFKNFVQENFDVVKHFIADHLFVEKIDELAQLGKGEGRIVRYEQQQIAVCKDENGRLAALHPVCPHAGCIVQWNSAEKSWDCPCHGARYSMEGELLNGPASKSLQKISLEQQE